MKSGGYVRTKRRDSLENISWIQNDGRFSSSLKMCKANLRIIQTKNTLIYKYTQSQKQDQRHFSNKHTGSNGTKNAKASKYEQKQKRMKKKIPLSLPHSSLQAIPFESIE